MSHRFPLRQRIAVWSLPVIILLASAALAQPTVEVVATDLATPLGVAVAPDGRVWVAEAGSGEDDGRVSVLTDGGLVPVIEGFGSVGFEGEVDGVAHLLFHDGALWVVGGAGPMPAADLWRVDVSDFTPGDPPLGPADADASYAVGAWVLDQGFAETNVYNATPGLDGDLFIADAAANSIIRLSIDIEELSVFATLEPVPTGGSPPVADPVPTALLFDDDAFFVSLLTGFPFADGASRVMRLDAEGMPSVHHDDLTLLTDIARDPTDGRTVVLQFARFDLESGYLPGTGRVLKLDGGAVEVVADELNLTAGLAFATDGALYVTSLFGQLLRVTPQPTSSEHTAVPRASALHAAYPNPFATATELGFRLAAPAHVRLTVHDLLGRQVATVADRRFGAGDHALTFEAGALPAGLYVARLEAGAATQTVKLVKVR